MLVFVDVGVPMCAIQRCYPLCLPLHIMDDVPPSLRCLFICFTQHVNSNAQVLVELGDGLCLSTCTAPLHYIIVGIFNSPLLFS